MDASQSAWALQDSSQGLDSQLPAAEPAAPHKPHSLAQQLRDQALQHSSASAGPACPTAEQHGSTAPSVQLPAEPSPAADLRLSAPASGSMQLGSVQPSAAASLPATVSQPQPRASAQPSVQPSPAPTAGAKPQLQPQQPAQAPIDPVSLFHAAPVPQVTNCTLTKAAMRLACSAPPCRLRCMHDSLLLMT